MCKIIILPNKEKLPFGMLIKLNNDLNLNSICDILLNNNIQISHFCEKFGKCNTCKVNIKEGGKFLNIIEYEEQETLKRYSILNKNIRLSCQLFIKSKINLILKIY